MRYTLSLTALVAVIALALGSDGPDSPARPDDPADEARAVARRVEAAGADDTKLIEELAKEYRDRPEPVLLAKYATEKAAARKTIDRLTEKLLWPEPMKGEKFPLERFKKAVEANRWSLAMALATANPELFDEDARKVVRAHTIDLWNTCRMLNPAMRAERLDVRADRWVRGAEFQEEGLNSATVVAGRLTHCGSPTGSTVFCRDFQLGRPHGIYDSVVVSAGNLECGTIHKSLVIVCGSVIATGVSDGVLLAIGNIQLRGSTSNSCVGSFGKITYPRGDGIRRCRFLPSEELARLVRPEWETSLGVRIEAAPPLRVAEVIQKARTGQDFHQGDELIAVNGRDVDSQSAFELACGSALASRRLYVTIRRDRQFLVLSR